MIVVEHHSEDEEGMEVIEKITNVRNIFIGIRKMQIIQIVDGEEVPIEKSIFWVNEIYYE